MLLTLKAIMSHALIRKLEGFGPLPTEDRALIETLTNSPRAINAGADIIVEGDRPSDVNLIVAGFAIRSKALTDGSRQIVAYLVPGEFCDLHVFLHGTMDHTISALTDVQLVRLSRPDILRLLDRPAISRAMLMATLVDEAVMREWLTNIGLRSAEMRIAHFCCEWYLRLNVIGMTSGNSCELPITQAEIGETIGLSTVHVNRLLQVLKARELLILKKNDLLSRIFTPSLKRVASVRITSI